jgi:hypothetical protein
MERLLRLNSTTTITYIIVRNEFLKVCEKTTIGTILRPESRQLIITSSASVLIQLPPPDMRILATSIHHVRMAKGYWPATSLKNAIEQALPLFAQLFNLHVSLDCATHEK